MGYMKKIKIAYIASFLLLIIAGCAKRGNITGGDKDVTPPKITQSSPKNLSTNFNAKLIKITFNEYIKVKDLQKQLIVSPLMKKPVTVLPQGGASKYITIKINDTLQPNTTYSFNFGQSIVDYNEENPYPQLKYVFSTGNLIDSLSIEGIIKDSYEKKTPNFVNVMLYEVDDKYNDSVVYKKSPRYVTNTLDSLETFKLENIKAGQYKLVALKETNNNYKFDSNKEKFAFYNKTITVPDKSLFELELFQEALKFKVKKATQASGNRITLGFEGDAKDLKAEARLKNAPLKIRLTKVAESDSINVWFAPIKNDSVQLNVQKEGYKSDFVVKIKPQKQDTLMLAPKQNGLLGLNEDYSINTATPLEKFDFTKMSLTRKDASKVSFKTQYDEFNQNLAFIFDKEPDEKYVLTILPKAIEDYLGKANDSLSYTFSTKNAAEYGNLKINLKNVKALPVIVELTDTSGKILYTQYTEKNTSVEFLLVEPKKYSLRIIYDENKNKKRDSGNFLENRQPEEVVHFTNEIDVRANWDVNQDFDLGK
jgi:uncharacterized protein (DUF2141 family)